jgi:hypothetical protein
LAERETWGVDLVENEQAEVEVEVETEETMEEEDQRAETKDFVETLSKQDVVGSARTAPILTTRL